MQYLLNTLPVAGMYALVGLGFALAFRVGGFFHFAHGVVFTAGAYFAFLFNVWLGFPLFISIFSAILCSTVLGSLMEFFPYRPLRRKGASPLVLLLASLGIYVVFQNMISIIFGDDTKSIRSGPVKEGLSMFGARITPIQVLTILISVVLIVVVAILLKKTKIGKAMRAVASDPEQANICGLNSDKIVLVAFALGSALAGVAGILVALDVDMTPTMGMNALMMGIVAVIIGGVDSIIGIVLGALLLGLAQNVVVWYIGSQWQDAIAFAILFVFLLIKPEGFLGKKIRRVTV